MITSVKGLYNYSKIIARASSLATTTHVFSTKTLYTTSSQRNFGSFFKRNHHGKESSRKKSFFEGLFEEETNENLEQEEVFQQTKTYEKLAENYFCEGEYQKALENYKKARNLLRDRCEDNFSGIAYYTGRAGDVYYEVNEWDHAINCYKEGLELLKGNARGKDDDKGRLLFRLGMCYLNENNYGETVNYMKETKKFYGKAQRSEKRDSVIASSSSILADCYMSLGQYEKALNHLEKVMEVLKKRTSTTDVALTQCYLNYGLALAYTDRDFNRALLYMREHQNAQIKYNGEDSFSAGLSYLKIGEVYSLQGRFSKALDNFEKALNILEDRMENNDKWTGMCHKAIGQAYGMQGDYEACIEHTKKAVDCFEDGTAELSECYKNMAFAYSAMMKHETALKNLKLSVWSRERVLEGFEEEDLQFMVLSGFLADACYKKQEYSEAMVHTEALLKEVCRFVSNECSKKVEK